MIFRSTSIIALILVAFAAFAQGVRFEESTWDKVIQKARDEHKLIFVDVYADWCAPCKKMDRVTFSDQEVGEYINKNFVSYKADYKSPTGNMLSKKHGVGSFPTYLFIDTNGNLVYKARGFMESSRFIKEAQVASNPGVYNKYKLYRKKFNAGNRDSDMLHEYLILGAERYKQPSDTVYYAFYKSLNLMELQDEANLKTLAMYLPYADGPAFDLALDYYTTLDESASSRPDIGLNLHDALDRHMHQVCAASPEDQLNELVDRKRFLIQTTHPNDSARHERIVDDFKIHYLECGSHWMAYTEEANHFVHQHIISPERLHNDTTVEKSLAQGVTDMQDAAKLVEFANHVNEHIDDNTQIKRAIEWVDQAIKWNEVPEYYATKAYLLKKAGNLDEAVNVARRALENARKTNSDYAKQMEKVLLSLVDGKSSKGINPDK